MTVPNPFLDEDQRPALYGDARRLTQRTTALGAAKVSGAPVAEVIAGFFDDTPDHVLDVGCGRGGVTAHLVKAWLPSQLTALDTSPALLDDAATRLAERAPELSPRVRFVAADFHDIPLSDDSVDVIVAAFCLYHSTDPGEVLAECRRCLRRNGRVILVTKSADSYAALDALVADAGLDPGAVRRPSLYESFHSGNAEAVTASALRVDEVTHHHHRFRFSDPTHTARYLITNPKYDLPEQPPHVIAEQLNSVLTGNGVSAESTVTYVVASKT
ncbi:class I SAM-dependent methyltransferase [Actinopolyspora halophila]|uniref:class I SAM-dependent methyltransferase n=1 Tax=Actinopolyspora halophila TaxID=1850 RepID=UPI0003A09F97|nr:class I SAM-dependent methyltransferase [Actinopolyspora halophila]